MDIDKYITRQEMSEILSGIAYAIEINDSHIVRELIADLRVPPTDAKVGDRVLVRDDSDDPWSSQEYDLVEVQAWDERRPYLVRNLKTGGLVSRRYVRLA